MNNEEGPKALHTGFDGKCFTTAGVDIDLVTQGPTGNVPREWCILEAAAASTLTVDVVGVDGQSDRTRPYPADLLLRVPRVLGITKILAASTSGIKIFVTW